MLRLNQCSCGDIHRTKLINGDSSIAQMDATKNGIKTYGIPLVYEPGFEGIDGYQQPLHKTTVCKTENGLRLYATRDIINKDGLVQIDNGHHHEALDKYWDELLLNHVGVDRK